MSGKIAPHEGQEVRLVMAGVKPLATIEKDKQPLAYAMAISLAAAGAVSVYCLNAQDRDCAAGEVVVVSPKNKSLINDYVDLLHNGVQKYGLHEFHRRMGLLFGYSEADINEFIKQDIGCDCKKCRGGHDEN